MLIHTSGFDVGLPEGTMGNSEVGHQNIGAGRIVDQESVAITKEIRDGEFFDNAELNAAVTNALKNGTNLHLFGIVVRRRRARAARAPVRAAWSCAAGADCSRVFLHAFTDGRDTSPNSGLGIRPAGRGEDEASSASGGSRPSAGGTTRWTATTAGRASRRPTARSSSATGRSSRTAEEAVTRYYEHPTEPNMSGDEFVTPVGHHRRRRRARPARPSTTATASSSTTTAATARAS